MLSMSLFVELAKKKTKDYVLFLEILELFGVIYCATQLHWCARKKKTKI